MNVIPFPSRRNSRIPCHTQATVLFDGRIEEGLCRSLSLTGAFIEGPALPLGQEVKVLLTVGGAQIELSGWVCHPSEEGMDVQFTRLSPEALRGLHAFVVQLAA